MEHYISVFLPQNYEFFSISANWIVSGPGIESRIILHRIILAIRAYNGARSEIALRKRKNMTRSGTPADIYANIN